MAEVMQSLDVKNAGRKRKTRKSTGKMAKKRQRMMPNGAQNKVKVDQKMKRLFQKRARDYNSDEEGEDEPFQQSSVAMEVDRFKKKDDEFEDDEENQASEAEEVSEDENGEIQGGVTKFTDGIKSFRMAFKKIVKDSGGGGDEDILGPVLSAHKKLLAEKLAEEESERKVKGEVKKEKHLIGERGHVKPANYLDTHEKYLLGVATKGVVKLFNAVNKAQNAQKGLNPSRLKDEKIIKKKRKEAFFSELGRTSSHSAGTIIKGGKPDDEAPTWAPLRDNYMLTNPKLKDWDKMQDTNNVDDFGSTGDADSSSEDD